MEKETLYIEEIKMILDLLPVSKFCGLCSISRVYYYKLIKTMNRYEIYKKYCG